MFALDAEHHLRLLRRNDGPSLARAYRENREHLAPWEPLRSEQFYTAEWHTENLRQALSSSTAHLHVRLVIEDADGCLRGRVNLNNIVHGAFCSADLGYWVDRSRVSRGLATRAVAVALEHARAEVGLHRVQAATLTHNTASQRVLAANGFTRIGAAARYLRIAGEWQDHLLFQRLLEDEVTPTPGRP